METPQKKPEMPQQNKVLKLFSKNGNASKKTETPQKKRGNTSTLNIGKRLKNIRKPLTLFQF